MDQKFIIVCNALLALWKEYLFVAGKGNRKIPKAIGMGLDVARMIDEWHQSMTNHSLVTMMQGVNMLQHIHESYTVAGIEKPDEDPLASKIIDSIIEARKSHHAHCDICIYNNDGVALQKCHNINRFFEAANDLPIEMLDLLAKRDQPEDEEWISNEDPDADTAFAEAVNPFTDDDKFGDDQ